MNIPPKNPKKSPPKSQILLLPCGILRGFFGMLWEEGISQKKPL